MRAVYVQPCTVSQTLHSRLCTLQVYAARDIETRTHEQEAKKKGNEEDEEEMAFRDMHAAERSLSLNRRFGTDGKQQSDLDEIRTCIRDFKSHIHFPEGGVDVVVKVEASSSSHHESATGMRGKDKFGRVWSCPNSLVLVCCHRGF